MRCIFITGAVGFFSRRLPFCHWLDENRLCPHSTHSFPNQIEAIWCLVQRNRLLSTSTHTTTTILTIWYFDLRVTTLFFLLNFNLSDIFTGSTYSRICQFIFQPFLPVIELNSILFSLSFSDSLVRRFPLCFEIKWHHTQQIERRESERESEILTRMTEWNTKKGMQFIFFIFHFGSATKESKSYTHTQCVRELPTTFVNFAILTSNT